MSNAPPDEKYETGYREGESSGYADWIAALDEYLDVEADSPLGAVVALRAKLESARVATIEECAKVADRLASAGKDDSERRLAYGIAEAIRSLSKKEGK